MYEYLQGELIAIYPEVAIVDVGGIGFRINISKTCSSRATASGKEVRFWVEFVVREDSHTLFGFMTVEDRDFFRLLQHVTGIGPKMALNILGHTPAPELADGIFQKNAKMLVSLPGVGKKLAERIIIELHERVGTLVQSGTVELSANTKLLREGIRALETLGFSSSEARSTILATQKQFPKLDSVEKLIQHTLARRK